MVDLPSFDDFRRANQQMILDALDRGARLCRQNPVIGYRCYLVWPNVEPMGEVLASAVEGMLDAGVLEEEPASSSNVDSKYVWITRKKAI